jgi:hypothetical protein
MSLRTPAQRAAAARAARDERLAGTMFMSDAECRLRERNHVECSDAGIVNERDVRRHGDALVNLMKPVMNETNLSAQEILLLRREMASTGMNAEQSASRHAQFVSETRKGLFDNKGKAETHINAVKAAAHESPALRQALNTGNAANSVPLMRSLYRRVIEDGQPIARKAPRQ